MPWLYKHKHLIIICYFFPPHLMKLLLWNEKCTASTNEYELVRTRLPNDNQHDFCICKKYLRLGTCARWKIGCSLNNVKCKCRSRNHARQKRNEFFFLCCRIQKSTIPLYDWREIRDVVEMMNEKEETEKENTNEGKVSLFLVLVRRVLSLVPFVRPHSYHGSTAVTFLNLISLISRNI